MKTKTFFIILTLLVYATSMLASIVNVDGISYDVDNSNLTASVTSQRPKYTGGIIIPETITYNNEVYSVTGIGEKAFYECHDLTSITIPNSITIIGISAFSMCNNLTSATIGNGVISIEHDAFWHCTNLTSVVIPNNVKDIGIGAFAECSSLASITLSNSVVNIGEWAFRGCSMNSITIPNSVTSIGTDAFCNCTNLTSVTFPNSVTSIGGSIFHGCIGLSNPIYNSHIFAFLPIAYSGAYSIPSGIEQIAGGAFMDCSSLTSVTIPNSVTSIGEGAFYNCSGLTSITCEVIVPPTCGPNTAFYHVNESIPVYVPEISVEAYKTAEVWKEFTNILPIATAIDNINIIANCYKKIKNDQLLILRDGKTYTIQGQELK